MTIKMAKRKVQFSDVNEEFSHNNCNNDDDDDNHIENDNDQVQEGNYAFGKKYKRTLDSDEEDDEEEAQNYNVLDVDDLGGQEDKTVDFDGDIKITPFNMNEELEEGHFDKEGTFIFHKNDDIKDNWLDNIDWVKIKDVSNENSKTDEENDALNISKINISECYQQMIELMLPGEKVQQAIQRFGKSSGKSKHKWRKKNDGSSTSNNNDNNEEFIEEQKEKLLKLSSLTDKVLQTGDMDIYDRTYEQLQFHLNTKTNNNQNNNHNNENIDDMFADDFDANKKVEPKNENQEQLSSNEVMWEYKWEDKDEAKIYGPFNSKDMLAWVNQGYFDNGIYVRQIGKDDSRFYSSKRIDFELYT